MRIVSILAAVLVVGVLYMVVLERDTLLAMAGRDASADATLGADEVPVGAETAEMPSGPVVPVVALRSNAQTVDSAVVVRGRTEATRQVDVRAETSGLVVSSPLRKGQRVETGQLLCQIDLGTRPAALAEAEARLAEAEARLIDAEVNERAASRLSEGGFAAETRLTAARAAAQSARAGVLSAEAGVAAAETELRRVEIRAPFGGLLETDSAELGALLQPGGVCATIVQLDPMKLVGFVPEVDVSRVHIGSPAGARLADGREVLGQVSFISRSADENTRTFRVEVEVDNADETISDGQTADIFIASDGASAHLLPQSALTLNDEGRMGVRTVEDGRAAFTPVSVVRDTTEGIWVSGLSDAAEIIVVGQEFVTDGVPVSVTYREPAR